MLRFLLQLLGVQVEEATRVAEASLVFRAAEYALWAALAAMVLAAAVIWMYRRSGAELSPGRRYTLTALRVSFLVLLLAMLLQPVLALTIEGSLRRTMVMLFDESASMSIADPRVDAMDVQRAAIGRGGDAETPGGASIQAADAPVEIPRIELVQAVLKNTELDLLSRLRVRYDVRPFTFGTELKELREPGESRGGSGRGAGRRAGEADRDWIDRLDAHAPATAAGDALRQTLSRTRGQPLAGIFIAWDGQSNAGISPLTAAEEAARQGVPLYLYGVGVTSPRDIIVHHLSAPDVAFVEDEIEVTVRVSGQGLAGESAELLLRLDDRTVATERITFTGGDAEQLVPLRFAPDDPGKFELVAHIEPRPDETVADNNTLSRPLRIIDDRISVLYVEQSPRWEFRYLQAALLRDGRIDLHNVLFEADPGLADDEQSPYLRRFPATEAELFEYDLLILGDVDVGHFTSVQLEAMRRLVSELGGGMILIAGRGGNPLSYRGTPLEAMLPVEVSADARGAAISDRNGEFSMPIRVERTPAGRRSLMLRLGESDEENERLWSDLPPIYWLAPVGRARPAAEVLLLGETGDTERQPLLAMQQFGAGQVLYVGTDNTWRWRRLGGGTHHAALWGQMVQRLTLPRLLGESRQTQLSTDRPNPATGDRVTIYARLYTEDFLPVELPRVRGYLEGEDGPRRQIELRSAPDQAGLFQGELVAPAPGQYRFWVETDEQTTLDLPVHEPRIEFAETAMNEALMRAMAELSGGAFLREEDLHALPDLLRDGAEVTRSRREVELWSTPLYFLLLLSVVTAEWVLRKVWYLK